MEILFIDDQPFFARRYIEALRSEFAVHYADRAEDGLVQAQANDAIRALVLDFMMPPFPGAPVDKVEDGDATGLCVLEQLKPWILERPMPVLVLTHRDLKIVKTLVGKLDFPKSYVDVRSKEEVKAERVCLVLRQLVDTVDALEKTKKKGSKP